MIEESAKSLNAMQAKIDTDKMKASSFLMVLTGTGITHTDAPTACVLFL